MVIGFPVSHGMNLDIGDVGLRPLNAVTGEILFRTGKGDWLRAP